jgi:uncharacterized protein (DUF488 family)
MGSLGISRDGDPVGAGDAVGRMSSTIWTIGHSTRSIEEFLAVLAAHDIEALADVRRFPGSRRLPWFGAEALAKSLAEQGIAYVLLESLGGRRRPVADSPNDGWRNDAFRAYADWTATPEFARGLDELLAVALGLRTAVMCSELLWWRCHRRIIADVLVTLELEVVHIRDERPGEPHRLSPPARILRGALTWSALPDAEPAAARGG